MSYYLAVLSEHEGCDYTIGCGITTEVLHADTETEAVEEVRVLLRKSYGHKELCDVSIYLVEGSVLFDVKEHYAAEKARKAAEVWERQEREERATLAALTKKYRSGS